MGPNPTGACVGGHDVAADAYPPTDAADPVAPTAAGLAPAATGAHAAAGESGPRAVGRWGRGEEGGTVASHLAPCLLPTSLLAKAGEETRETAQAGWICIPPGQLGRGQGSGLSCSGTPMLPVSPAHLCIQNPREGQSTGTSRHLAVMDSGDRQRGRAVSELWGEAPPTPSLLHFLPTQALLRTLRAD